jgi:uncharacterized membrane protein
MYDVIIIITSEIDGLIVLVGIRRNTALRASCIGASVCNGVPLGVLVNLCSTFHIARSLRSAED